MLTVEDIRVYTKDVPELNILLEGNYQSSEELVALAMRLAVSDFNATPPVTTFSAENFPNDSVLLMGVLYHLANSEAERQLRNQANYSAQGLSAGIDDKHPQYLQLAQVYKQYFESKAASLKAFINVDQAWGNVPSPYAGLNNYKFGS